MEKKVNKNGGSKVAKFFKKNAYYILLLVSLLAVGAIITVALVLGNKPEILPPDNGGEIPVVVDPAPVAMLVPVESDFTIGHDFKVDGHVWYNVLGRFSAHKGVDFNTETSAGVVSVLDGTVESVSHNVLTGNKVVILHKDGVRSIYQSLSDDVRVGAGDTVTRGQVIGYTSDSMRISKDQGNHLHFEVTVNNVNVNPHDYVTVAADK